MLALTRRPGETVHIGDNITVTVVEVRGDKVRLAFEAPRDVRIMRGELLEDERKVTVCDAASVHRAGTANSCARIRSTPG